MINYIFIAIVGYAFLAVVAILDKHILSRSLRLGAYTFYSTIFFFAAFAFLPFSDPISSASFLLALLSGLSFGFAIWAMFLGLEHHEATHMIPFIGALTAIFVYGLSAFFLGETLSFVQSTGIILLVFASLLFSYEKGKGHKELHPTFGWGIVSGFLFAVAHVSAKYFYGEYSFVTGIVWTKGLVGIVGLVTLLSVLTRKDVFSKNKKQTDDTNSAGLVIVDKVFSVIGTLAVQYAISIGSVSVITGLVGLQYGLILILASISTIVAPRFFSEYFTRKEVAVEAIAIMLVIGGVMLLV